MCFGNNAGKYFFTSVSICLLISQLALGFQLLNVALQYMLKDVTTQLAAFGLLASPVVSTFSFRCKRSFR